MSRAVLQSPTMTDDTPIRLAEAARMFFPEGSGVTEATLRRMAAKGKLTVERIAGKDFTTAADIRVMRAKCRPAPKEHDSGLGQPAPATPPSGSSKTGEIKEALAAARMKLRKQKPDSPSTSR